MTYQIEFVNSAAKEFRALEPSIKRRAKTLTPDEQKQLIEITDELEQTVAQRANYCCEYCLS